MTVSLKDIYPSSDSTGTRTHSLFFHSDSHPLFISCLIPSFLFFSSLYSVHFCSFLHFYSIFSLHIDFLLISSSKLSPTFPPNLFLTLPPFSSPSFPFSYSTMSLSPPASPPKPVDSTLWSDVKPYNAKIQIDSILPFEDFSVISGREEGLERIWLMEPKVRIL